MSNHGLISAMRRAIGAAGGLALFACHTAVAPAAMPAAPEDSPGPLPAANPGSYAYSTALTGDVHDFDFRAGAWTFRNRRLKKRFIGSNDWDEFPGVDCAQIYLGGSSTSTKSSSRRRVGAAPRSATSTSKLGSGPSGGSAAAPANCPLMGT